MLTKTLKNVEFKLFQSDGQTMVVEAYASTFGNVDSGRDIVEKGSFTKTLQENKKRIKTLFNHDWNQIIGKPLEMNEDSKGLYTKTQFVSTIKSEEIYVLVKEGIVNELSIGYDIVKNDYDKVNKINRLRELKLYEYSFVTFAMNDQAQVTDVKFDNLLNEIKAGRVLSDKNINSIKDAIAALNALLDSNTPDQPSNTDMCNDPTKSHDDEIDYDKLLFEIKKLRK
jgi:hypothetical protein